MDLPMPGSSLNSSIISQWQQAPAKRPASRNRAKIALNSTAPPPAATSSGTSSPLRKGLSRGVSPVAADEETVKGAARTIDEIENREEAAAAAEMMQTTALQAEPMQASTSSAGAKRSYMSSTLTQTQPSTKRTRSSRAADPGQSRTSGQASSSSGLQSRESLLMKYPPPNLKLSLLGGLHEQITQLLEMVALPLLHPEIYRHTGVRAPRGVLLHGVPGGGKTRLVTCLAGELQVPFISISAPSLVSSLSGDTEKLLRQTFDEAKSIAPCILFLDEVDAITPKRENAQREMEKRIVGQLLTCLDDLADHPEPVIVLAATNRPDSLDPALRRAGRFDHEIEMGVPSAEAREEILKVLCSSLKLAGDIDFHALAHATPGYVGADLTALTGAAGVAAVKRIFQAMGEGKLELPEDNKAEGASIVEMVDGHEEHLGKVTEGVEDMMVIDVDADDSRTTTNQVSAQSDTEVTDLVSRRTDGPLQSLPAIIQKTPIAHFLLNHPKALTTTQLSPLHLIPSDFTQALKTVQPSAKREGFATVPDITWADIGALHGVRDELHMAIVQPIRRPEIFKAVGITAPSGVLLWGPPGCGKTLLAKAVANESRANFISVKGPELLNKYVGESERAVRQVFVRARASSPCVIFFDELDALVPRRDDSMSESSARVVNTLLTELDGLDARKAVYVVGATNRPDMIDPAMVRPGRLDKLLYVDLPTPQERVEILKTQLSKTPLAEGAWDRVAEIVMGEKCEGFSGADMSSLVREAATLALRGALEAAGAFENDDDTIDPNTMRPIEETSQTPEIKVTVEHFAKAAEKTLPSVSREQKRKYEALRNKFAGLPARGGKKWAEGKGLAMNGGVEPAKDVTGEGSAKPDEGLDLAA